MPDRHPVGRPDAAALAELFERHRDGLAGAVRAIVGADGDPTEVLQDAFVRAYETLQRGFAPEDPVAWSFVVTMNLARDRRRRHARRPRPATLDEVPEMELTATEGDPTTSAETAEAIGAARAAIRRLTEPEKDVFLLRVSAGLSFPAAARALGIPVGTAKTRMRSALMRLRQELAGFAPEDTARRNA